ncbi:hypothetical protein TRVA0_056S00452 [Trichomonascus vanleenenianus]|uniref:uncharacterized protein n=1 Tax=Trichomonascus vanleenenianus TaxID=2268995 RepID=UPI003ECA2822
MMALSTKPTHYQLDRNPKMARAISRQDVMVQFIPSAGYHEIETCTFNAARYHTQIISTPKHNGQCFEALFRTTEEGLSSLRKMPYVLNVKPFK